MRNNQAGINIGERRLRGVVAKFKLQIRPHKKFIATTDSNHNFEVYVKELNDHGFIVSCSRKGNPYDNAFVESFMKTLKDNEVYLYDYRTLLDVIERLPHFIEEVYNKKRLHSSLNYLTPEEFENKIETGYHHKNNISHERGNQVSLTHKNS